MCRLGAEPTGAALALRQGGEARQNELLSPRYQWMAAKETDAFKERPTTFIEAEGTTLKAALDVSRKYGTVRDTVMPFAAEGSTGSETFYALAAQLKVSMYFNLGRALGLASLARDQGADPHAAGRRLDLGPGDDDQGKLDSISRRPSAADIVALVGYTPDTFIVRTARARAGATEGCAYASLAYAQDAFAEAYGVEL